MDKRSSRLIYLHQVSGITRSMLRKILEIDPTLKSFFEMSPREWSLQLSIPLKNASIIYSNLHRSLSSNKAQEELENMKILTIFDPAYPRTLKMIHDPPYVLYCIGNDELLDSTKSIAVIGTRQPSTEARRKTNFLLSPLIHENWTIISGLAYGIDRLAHEITLSHQGNTIAVLGSGFHHIYPSSHRDLFEQISQKGLVISEYAPHVRAKRYHFPERNRIVSGLSQAILVIEAKERSGTNITVAHALDQGKEVYAVPGSILSSTTVGCHRMIQDGAKLVMNAQDILEDYRQASFSI